MKKILITSGALIGLFLAGSVMQSSGSRAKGAYSTPVTAMNAAANPVITYDADRTAQVPYEASVTQNCGSGFSNCQFLFVGPGAGHRWVIQNVSGQLIQGAGTTTLPNIQFNVSSNAIGNYWGIPPGPLVPTAFGGALGSMFNQAVQAFVDGGGSAGVVVYANHSGLDTVTLSGYIQDCSVFACAPLQH